MLLGRVLSPRWQLHAGLGRAQEQLNCVVRGWGQPLLCAAGGSLAPPQLEQKVLVQRRGRGAAVAGCGLCVPLPKELCPGPCLAQQVCCLVCLISAPLLRRERERLSSSWKLFHATRQTRFRGPTDRSCLWLPVLRSGVSGLPSRALPSPPFPSSPVVG